MSRRHQGSYTWGLRLEYILYNAVRLVLDAEDESLLGVAGAWTITSTNPDSSYTVTTYDYDDGGRLKSVDYTHDPENITDLDYVYDRLNRLVSVERDGSTHAEYDYSSDHLTHV